MLWFCSIHEINMSDTPKARQELICYHYLNSPGPAHKFCPLCIISYSIGSQPCSQFFHECVSDVGGGGGDKRPIKILDFPAGHSEHRCWWINQNVLHASAVTFDRVGDIRRHLAAKSWPKSGTFPAEKDLVSEQKNRTFGISDTYMLQLIWIIS